MSRCQLGVPEVRTDRTGSDSSARRAPHAVAPVPSPWLKPFAWRTPNTHTVRHEGFFKPAGGRTGSLRPASVRRSTSNPSVRGGDHDSLEQRSSEGSGNICGRNKKLFGANGTKVTSKTLANGVVGKYKYRIDVENPAPGKRAGVSMASWAERARRIMSIGVAVSSMRAMARHCRIRFSEPSTPVHRRKPRRPRTLRASCSSSRGFPRTPSAT